MKELVKGCKVKVKENNRGYGNKIGTVSKIRECFFTYPILVRFDNLDFDIAFTESDLEIVKEATPKQINAIQYYNGSIIIWNKIDSLNLKVSIKGRVNMTTLCKILLKYVDGLRNFTYKRVCPYKIIHEYARDRDDKTHLFYIKYLTIQEEIKTQNIIQTDSSMSIIEGEYNFFIPDLLEVAKDRNLVKLDGDTYIGIEKKLESVLDCKEIRMFNRVTLENTGWTVPNQFEKYFNVLN